MKIYRCIPFLEFQRVHSTLSYTTFQQPKGLLGLNLPRGIRKSTLELVRQNEKVFLSKINRGGRGTCQNHLTNCQEYNNWLNFFSIRVMNYLSEYGYVWTSKPWIKCLLYGLVFVSLTLHLFGFTSLPYQWKKAHPYNNLQIWNNFFLA